jgi:hypothetical protein
LLACFVGVCAVSGEESPAKAKVELRWVETKKVEGVTEEKGFQSSCDPDSIVYPHKKPALVLTATEVTEASLVNHDFSNSGLSKENYLITIHLTKEARDKLAAASDKTQNLVTVVVDGKCWGLFPYSKNKPLIPAAVQAETFTPIVGFFSSKDEAQRVVDALK